MDAVIKRIAEVAETVEVVGPELQTVIAAAQAFAHRSRAASTQAAYARDWRDFAAWCEAQGFSALPAAPQTVALYLTARAERLKTATLERRLASVAVMHRRAGQVLDVRHPLLVEVWRGIRRTLGSEQQGKAPLLVDELRAMVAALPETLAGRRDRALLLLGFGGAFRRSELVGLDVDALRFSARGVEVRLRRSKSDQEGKGSVLGVARGAHADSCPVAAVKAWLVAARLSAGPLFRAVDRFGRLGEERLSDKAVARIIKRAAIVQALASGKSQKEAEEWAAGLAGHSLRAGFATAAAVAGADEWMIMRQTGHKRRETVQKYIRCANPFAGGATSIGL